MKTGNCQQYPEVLLLNGTVAILLHLLDYGAGRTECTCKNNQFFQNELRRLFKIKKKKIQQSNHEMSQELGRERGKERWKNSHMKFKD